MGAREKIERKSNPEKRQCFESIEAKEGFNLWFHDGNSSRLCGKAVTDSSMARILRVEPGEEIISAFRGKRECGPYTQLSRKENKIVEPTVSEQIGSSGGLMDMELHFALQISMGDNASGCVAGPSLPPSDQSSLSCGIVKV